MQEYNIKKVFTNKWDERAKVWGERAPSVPQRGKLLFVICFKGSKSSMGSKGYLKKKSPPVIGRLLL